MKIQLGKVFNFDRDSDYALMINDLVFKFNIIDISKDNPFPFINFTLEQLKELQNIIEREIKNEEANI